MRACGHFCCKTECYNSTSATVDYRKLKSALSRKVLPLIFRKLFIIVRAPVILRDSGQTSAMNFPIDDDHLHLVPPFTDVFIGSSDAAHNWPELEKHEITHIL